jgi:hypothetical protein
VITRRSFLKILGGTAAAAVAAPLITPAAAGPLFIPSQNLDMGVPRSILTATEMPTPKPTAYFVTGDVGLRQLNIPMLLVHDEFRPPGWQQYGREKVPAGTTLLVDRPTAERWVEHGVGTPGPAAPLELQEASVRLGMTRRATSQMTWTNTFLNADEISFVDDIPVAGMVASDRAKRYQRWSDSIERASARLKGVKASVWWESIPELPDANHATHSIWQCHWGDGDDATT